MTAIGGIHCQMGPGGIEGGYGGWYVTYTFTNLVTINNDADRWYMLRYIYDPDSDMPYSFCPLGNWHVDDSRPAGQTINPSPIRVNVCNGRNLGVELTVDISAGGQSGTELGSPTDYQYHGTFKASYPDAAHKVPVAAGDELNLILNYKLSPLQSPSPEQGYVRLWASINRAPSVKIVDVSNIVTQYGLVGGYHEPWSLVRTGFYTKGSPSDSSANDNKTFKAAWWWPRQGLSYAGCKADVPTFASKVGPQTFNPTIYSTPPDMDTVTDFIYPAELEGSTPTNPTIPAVAAGHTRYGVTDASTYTDRGGVTGNRKRLRNIAIPTKGTVWVGPLSKTGGILDLAMTPVVNALRYADDTYSDGASDPAGTMSVGGSDFAACIDVVNATGHIDKVWIFFAGTANGSGTEDIIGAVYSDDGGAGEAGTKLSASTEVAIPYPTTGAWYSFTVDAIPPSTAGDTTAPTLLAETVHNSTLQLTYNEPLDATSVPAVTAYDVEVNGGGNVVTSVSIVGSIVTLELTTPVISSDVVTVGYIAPGSGKIRDIAHNNAGNLSAHAVVNTTLGTIIPVWVTNPGYTVGNRGSYREDLGAGVLGNNIAFVNGKWVYV